MMDTASLDANSTLPCHYYLNLEPAGVPKFNLAEPVIDKYHADSSILEMWLITLAMMAAMWNVFKWFFRL